MNMRVLGRARAAAAMAISAVIWLAPSLAQAQNFPNRPVRIIVGPSPDVFARIIAEHLQEAWGQPVVVEPRPGGGGKIAVSSVTSAAPDGHTLLFATPTFTLATAMKLATYDFAKDLEPAALIGLIAYAMVVNPNVPANSVTDLVALAKAKPGEINCAPATLLKVSQARCGTVPLPADAQLISPGFALASATRSATEFAGTFGLTTIA